MTSSACWAVTVVIPVVSVTEVTVGRVRRKSAESWVWQRIWRPPLMRLISEGTFADDAAFVDDDDAMGEGVGLFEVVGCEEDSLAAGGKCADLLPETAAGFDVEADGGLVEEDEVGVTADGKREEDALLLAAAKLTELTVFEAFELGDTDDLGEGQRARVVAAEQVDVLPDFQSFGDAGNLQHGSDASASEGEARIAAEDTDLPGCGCGETEHQANGGGFARAVGTEEGYDFTRVQG